MVVPQGARSSTRRVPRRPVLWGMAAAVTTPLLVTALTGCGAEPPDPLVALAAQARADATLIEALRESLGTAGGAAAALAPRLIPVAQARRAHAETLAAELDDQTAPPGAATPPAAPPPAFGPDPEKVLAGVLAALDDSYQRAAAAVPTLPRSQAALVGSIAACCAAYRAVLG